MKKYIGFFVLFAAVLVGLKGHPGYACIVGAVGFFILQMDRPDYDSGDVNGGDSDGGGCGGD
jgi:hypothetical protein